MNASTGKFIGLEKFSSLSLSLISFRNNNNNDSRSSCI